MMRRVRTGEPSASEQEHRALELRQKSYSSNKALRQFTTSIPEVFRVEHATYVFLSHISAGRQVAFQVTV